MEVLAQMGIGPGGQARWVPAMGKEKGFAADCPGNSKEWEETHWLRICYMPGTLTYNTGAN